MFFKHCFNSIQLIFTYLIFPNIQFEILYFPMILLWSMIYIEACCSVSKYLGIFHTYFCYLLPTSQLCSENILYNFHFLEGIETFKKAPRITFLDDYSTSTWKWGLDPLFYKCQLGHVDKFFKSSMFLHLNYWQKRL